MEEEGSTLVSLHTGARFTHTHNLPIGPAYTHTTNSFPLLSRANHQAAAAGAKAKAFVFSFVLLTPARARASRDPIHTCSSSNRSSSSSSACPGGRAGGGAKMVKLVR
jgi:hypothetical protein